LLFRPRAASSTRRGRTIDGLCVAGHRPGASFPDIAAPALGAALLSGGTIALTTGSSDQGLDAGQRRAVELRRTSPSRRIAANGADD
jgi:hypothetical protein